MEDPVAGIVSHVTEVEAEPGAPDIAVVVGLAADVTAYGAPGPVASNGSGAGLTFDQAYGAAIGECVERYALGVIHPEELSFGSYAELSRRASPVPPDAWSLFADEQHADGCPFPAFTEETRIAWCAADDLLRREERLVPAALVYMPYPRPFAERGERVIAPGVSTGAACGHSPGESVLKGLCEVVERDAFMIMWRNRLPLPRLRIDGLSPLLSAFEERFAREGIDYTLIYTTLDIGLPSVFGIACDRRRNPPAVVVGGAAHLDPEQAALKTLLELAQALTWVDFMGQRSVAVPVGSEEIRSFDDRVRLYAFGDRHDAFSFLLDGEEEVALSAVRSLDTGTTAGNLSEALAWLSSAGLDALAVDVTPEDVREAGLFVSRVLVPQCVPMEGDHLRPFLGGSRWQEVPVRLGWRDRCPSLHSANPDPHPYP